MALFDKNCPNYFAPNEREDYAQFLSTFADDYWLVLKGQSVAAAVGLGDGGDADSARIQWIMVDPDAHQSGLGTELMVFAFNQAKNKQKRTIKISASHLSAPFFARFGAQVVQEIPHGWGLGMHRIDLVCTV